MRRVLVLAAGLRADIKRGMAVKCRGETPKVARVFPSPSARRTGALSEVTPLSRGEAKPCE